jgi:hypothetical protein
VAYHSPFFTSTDRRRFFSLLRSSTGLGWTFLLLLLGRSLVTPLWDVPSPGATGPGGAKANTALISWARLTRAMLIRPFRFLLPVIVVVAIQWGLSANGKTANCNNVGMDEPYWNLITNFAGFCTLIFNLVRCEARSVARVCTSRR